MGNLFGEDKDSDSGFFFRKITIMYYRILWFVNPQNVQIIIIYKNYHNSINYRTSDTTPRRIYSDYNYSQW